MKPILEVKNLSVEFDSGQVIKDLSFSVHKGDVLAVVGPNGAGKSVLFRALLDLIPHEGVIDWTENIRVSYVPQKLSIDRDLPLSVREFLQFKESSEEKVLGVLKSVGVSGKHADEHHLVQHIMNRRLGLLSGGELQRVLIAWSLLDRPDVLLYDEPTSGIDVGGEETIYNLLRKLQQERNLTILLISHDLNVVYEYANNVLCLNKTMMCFGVPAQVLDPDALRRLYGGTTSFYQHQHVHE